MLRLISSVVFVSCLLLSGFADAKDHAWFLANIKPTGQCTMGKEVATTFYWQGSHTASGERFDSNGNTVATWDYPLGSYLYVHNPRNGRSLTVRVNDRGPAKHLYRMGIKLDLAMGAARRLALGQGGRFESGYVCVTAMLKGSVVADSQTRPSAETTP